MAGPAVEDGSGMKPSTDRHGKLHVEIRRIRNDPDILHLPRDSTRLFALQNAMNTITVGVLALQGAFYEHVQLLKRAATTLDAAQDPCDSQWQIIEVRTPQELERCDALILPGGESTTISLVAASSNLLEPLRDFVK